MGVFAWAVVLLAIAFTVSYRTTRDLQWPNEHDLYREMASAQSLLQEGYGHDPCYAGETIWYNPLTHVALAAAQVVTGLPLPVVAARSGTYLNLLAPILFFLMAAAFLGRWTAVLALIGFLFCVGGSFPSWAAATYSPWLYPINFAQGFFYLLMIQLARLRGSKPTARWALGTGVLWGVTFLAHTGPAVLFAGILLAVMMGHLRPNGRWDVREVKGLLWLGVLLAGAFALVTLPFTFSIVGHYGLHLVNSSPNRYFPDFLGYRSIPLMIGRHLEVPVLVAWFGLYVLIRGRCEVWVRRIMMPWLCLTAAYLFYGYVVAGFAKVGVNLPMIIPSFHALFYFKAALSLLFAMGLMELARVLVARLAQRQRILAENWVPRTALVLALLVAAGEWPRYVKRYDYCQAREEALGHGAETNRIALYAWARENARPNDVFLSANDLGLFGLAAAGAKVVAVDPYFSSPYVEWTSRGRDRDRMFELLAAGQPEAFAELAHRYRVDYVADESDGVAIYAGLVGSLLQPVLTAGSIRLYRVIQ